MAVTPPPPRAAAEEHGRADAGGGGGRRAFPLAESLYSHLLYGGLRHPASSHALAHDDSKSLYSCEAPRPLSINPRIRAQRSGNARSYEI
jgi:hypothetical protein